MAKKKPAATKAPRKRAAREWAWLTPKELVSLLAAAGVRQPVTVELIQRDMAAGRLANADGTVHPVNFAAWLVMKTKGAGRPDEA